MNEFVYTYPTVVYFGEGTAQKHLKNLVSNYGKTVMRAYGGGPVKKNGIYDEVKGLLMEAGKEVVDFPACSTPPMPKCRRGPNWCGSAMWSPSWHWARVSVRMDQGNIYCATQRCSDDTGRENDHASQSYTPINLTIFC